MSLKFFLVFVALWGGSCRSTDSKEIAKDVCGCLAGLRVVNAELKQSVNTDNNNDMMKLFIEAGEKEQEAKNCIVSLSNTYGQLDKTTYLDVLDQLKIDCKDGVELFKKSGWYRANE